MSFINKLTVSPLDVKETPKLHLIDGGVASLVPVRFARATGAEIVIAVDIYCQSPNTRGLGAPTVIQRVMHAQSCMVAKPEMAEADLLISPSSEYLACLPAMNKREQFWRATTPLSRRSAEPAGYKDGG